MRAIRYKEQNGYKVVLGEGRLVVDPEATLAQARKAVSRLPASKELASLLRQVREGPGASITKDHPLVQKIAKQIQLAVLTHARENPVYFDSVPGQVLFSSEAAESLLGTEVPEDHVLLLSGSTIENLVGKSYFVKERGRWHQAQVQVLGEELPEGAILESALTEEHRAEMTQQNENDKWLAMTDDQVDEREAQALEAALKASAQRRYQNEISKGPEEALREAQEFYKAEEKRIIDKFEEVRNVRKNAV